MTSHTPVNGQGDLVGALSKYNESLAMDRDLHGDAAHPDIAASLNFIGSVLEHQGNLPGALSKYEESLTMMRDIYGDGHVLTLNLVAAVAQAKRLEPE